MNRSIPCDRPGARLPSLLRGRPQAEAHIAGSAEFPDISGTVWFYQTAEGVIVHAEISGLPGGSPTCPGRVFGFHIHEGSDCGGHGDDPFAHSMAHYDRRGRKHPHHAGDLPPLFGNDGAALAAFLTSRFSVEEIVGRTVIIHDGPDDFTSQPSGNAGVKIACGVIRRAKGPCR